MPRTDPRRISGAAAEAAAADALLSAGYVILARNLRTRAGEIDLVAARRGKVAFVEVKARRVGGLAGGPAEAFTARKLKRVARAAEGVLAARGIGDAPREFLGALVDLSEEGRPASVRIVPVEEIP